MEGARKIRAKRAAEPDSVKEKHWMKVQMQIQKLQKKKKEQTKRDKKKITKKWEYEQVRKAS